MEKNTASIKVSIIIPFYNSEDYVSRCLDSILTQSMPDFEIIAVNDGSLDNTISLLEDYAEKDFRIKLITIENGGSGWARNQGAMRATGEYIMFVDGDDFILPDALSELYNYAQANAADVVIFSYIPWQDGFYCNPYKYTYPKYELMDTLTATKLMLVDGDPQVWNKFIRRSLYVEKNICFQEGMLLEDVPVSCALLLNSKRIFYFDKGFYAYVQRGTSIMHLSATVRRTRDIIRCYELVMEEIRKAGYERELTSACDARYTVILLWLLRMCYARPEQYKSPEELNEAKAFLENRFSKLSLNHILSNPHLRLSAKIKAIRLKSGLYKIEKAVTKCFKSKREMISK